MREVLLPTLKSGDIVIMDNLTPYKNEEPLTLIKTSESASDFFQPTRQTLTRLKRCGVKLTEEGDKSLSESSCVGHNLKKENDAEKE